MAVLGPHCCVQAFSNCQEQGLLSRCGVWASPGGFSCCRAQAVGAQAQQLWCMGSVALWRVRSSDTRDQTSVPCFARGILNKWTTKKVPTSLLLQMRKPMYWELKEWLALLQTTEKQSRQNENLVFLIFCCFSSSTLSTDANASLCVHSASQFMNPFH